MERDLPIGNPLNKLPVEIDVRRILEQLGIEVSKWPEAYKKEVEQLRS